jgi:hypothetical protein
MFCSNECELFCIIGTLQQITYCYIITTISLSYHFICFTHEFCMLTFLLRDMEVERVLVFLFSQSPGTDSPEIKYGYLLARITDQSFVQMACI